VFLGHQRLANWVDRTCSYRARVAHVAMANLRVRATTYLWDAFLQERVVGVQLSRHKI
jgi:hypothetical protein